jgi:hypothetical protein
VVFLVGAFLVTPVGLLPLVAVAFFGPLFAPVLALARFLVVVAVGSGKVGKTLGREFPVPLCSAEASNVTRREAVVTVT